ncbi:two-component regulator propeller domain-containing protein [Desertivirga arenae]|uniref:two-component regulator propeller domain-containing protein n=1 Tax=Desertivirga arenae TaxID=2810309 RepID=UPI001A9777D2|nr:two-component regulator propeller domain-containing protein [Pedobacter sp. SYSU D00823]
MRILIVFITLVCSTLAASAIQDYPFTPIDGNNGLSDNQVRNIIQLPDGRMMITTEGLLNIYDGTSFKYLHYTNKNGQWLSGYSGFHHSYISSNGYLWLKNQHRLYLINLNKERFEENPKAFLKVMGINEDLDDFFADNEKNLWLISKNDELIYLRAGKKLKLFRHQVSSLTGRSDQVYDLAVLNKKLYLFYRSGYLICLDLASGREIYRQSIQPAINAGNYESTSFVIQGKNRFFQLKNGAAGGIMLTYNIPERKWETVLQTDYWLNYLSIDPQDQLWVTCKEGLWKLSSDLSRKEFIQDLKLVDGQIINTEVSTVYHDNQGGLWLGTLNRGLLYYHPERFKFRNIGKSLFKTASNATINITCFTEDQDGAVLVGTQQGVFRYHKKSQMIEPLNKFKQSLNCKALLRDSKNRIWLATAGEGLICMEDNGKIREFPNTPRVIYSLCETPDGSLYIGTGEESFGTFYPQTGTYRAVKLNISEKVNTVLQLITVNNNSVIGICRDGFFVYNPMNGKSNFYPGKHSINAILVDSRKQIWLGSKDGLHLWDLQKGLQRSFYTEQGLVNNYIQSIAEDKDGAIWVSTSNGITRLIWQKNNRYTFNNFKRDDGLIANEFTERSVYLGRNGNIFWGGTDGFNELPAQKTMRAQQKTVPLFVNFLLFNKKIESGVEYAGNTILNKPLPITKKIILNYDQNFFSLEFSSLNFINPTQTYYRYQLSGIDKTEREIQAPDGKGRASYTNLEPGKYHFRVSSANNARDWSGNYAEIEITVKAPFWKSGIAYCVYILLLLTLTVFLMWLYLQRKRRNLVREQKEKLNQMKSAFLSNVKEELNQPLDQIISPLDAIMKHTDEGRVKHQLKEIQNKAQGLKELVGQLSENVLAPIPRDENALNLEVLLLNMRRLIEHQKERRENIQDGNEDNLPAGNIMSVQDEKFIQKALKYVEENLDNPDYSVELLSKDMGMDRTGLYRKLLHVIGKTPSSFIRSVRLKRAALLLDQGLTVAEVADRVGFSTSSYLTKCFQEEFGMKPSQYLESAKQEKKAPNQ